MAAATAAGGMPNEVVGRPMPITFSDYNDLLDQEVAFFDAKGEKVSCCFWAALKNLESSAQGLQERVVVKNATYSSGEVPESIHGELEIFEEQFNQVAVIVTFAREILENFQAMRPTLDKTSGFQAEAKRIIVEGDIEEAQREIQRTANQTETHYLQEGSWGSYLPNHMNTLRGLAAARELQASDGGTQALEVSDVN